MKFKPILAFLLASNIRTILAYSDVGIPYKLAKGMEAAAATFIKQESSVAIFFTRNPFWLSQKVNLESHVFVTVPHDNISA